MRSNTEDRLSPPIREAAATEEGVRFRRPRDLAENETPKRWDLLFIVFDSEIAFKILLIVISLNKLYSEGSTTNSMSFQASDH